jgi:preprotein translocase subunit SecG
MVNIFLAAHIFIALMIIGLVLLQHGKGADMGASFGGGASKTVFGSRGAAPFLMKLTGFFALLFFATSLSLGFLLKEQVINANTLQAPTTINAPVSSSSTEPKSSEPVPMQSTPSPIDQLKDDSSMTTNKSSSNSTDDGSADSQSPLDQIKSQ